MLRLLGFEYLALVPGASFRGLHDSLVNYGGNERPSLLLCNHEQVAVFLAHGYAKATGRPMAVGLHTNVGLLNGTLGIFNAFVDRQPVYMLGGTGPMDSTKRRPGVDWHHTANGLGELVRDFTKWEQQPASVASIPEAMLRAWHQALVEPSGPIYLCLDAGLQEERLAQPLVLPNLSRYPLPAPIQPPREDVQTAARWLLDAQYPVILLGRIPPQRRAWDDLVEVAQLLGAAVVQDPRTSASFPTDHFLQQASMGKSGPSELNEVLRQADVVLALDRSVSAGLLRAAASGVDPHRMPGSGQFETPRLINVSLGPFAVRSWTTDFQELPAADLPILSNTATFIGELLEELRRASHADASARQRAHQRTGSHRARRARLEKSWRSYNASRWDIQPISIERAVGEMRSALGADYDDVMVARIPNTWPSGIWDFSKPAAYLGGDGGGGLGSGLGMTVGAAIGIRDSGRPVVAFLGDGDTLFAPSALWTAAHYRVPALFVVANNQSYFNDEEHQDWIARVRRRPVENRWLGQRMDDPPVDFAALARSLGVEAFGPVLSPGDLAGVYAEAVRTLQRGEPVLVDVRIDPR
jgi:thiamine pyrophosphate-dependent acetolactate synthase large subunit-like protein